MGDDSPAAETEINGLHFGLVRAGSEWNVFRSTDTCPTSWLADEPDSPT